MRAFLTIAIAILLTACSGEDVDVGVGGELDVNFNENISECQILQYGSTLYVQRLAPGRVYVNRMGLDATIVYPFEWTAIKDADLLRENPYTDEELDVITGVVSPP